MNKKADEVIREIETPSIEQKQLVEFIPTSCTVLNLSLGGGFALGRIINLVGDKSSGKTFLASDFISFNAMTRKDFSWYYDNAEYGYGFNIYQTRGIDVLKDNDEDSSTTVEEFQYKLESKINSIKPKENNCFVYVLDSLDTIGSQEESDQHKKEMGKIKKQLEEGKEQKITGSYNMQKPKKMSQYFRQNLKMINDKRAILVIISQVRHNIGVIFGEQYTRAGGKALDHNASQIIWLSECKKLTKTYEGKEYIIGVRIKAKTKKNRVYMPFKECFIDIYFNKGIDNITTNINYLYDLIEKTGKEKSKKLEWDGVEYTKRGLVNHIKTNKLEKELDQRVIDRYKEIEKIIYEN